MKSKALVLSILVALICTGTFNTIAYDPSADTVELEDIKILVLIEVAFGWNYFDVVETFESWGVNVTTVGPMASTPSCANREQRPVAPEIITDEIDNDTILQFDGLMIPSGGHWNALAYDSAAQNLIATAYELGLHVGGICTGPIPLSRAGQILNGTRIAAHPTGYTYYNAADAIRIIGARVACDNRVVTGGSGSGPPTGYEGAPTNETCRTMVRDILGYSLVSDCTLNPTEVQIDTNFSISVELSDLSTAEEGMFDYNADEVVARVINIANMSEIEEITLIETDGTYTGTFSGLDIGEYRVDIQIEDDESIFTVCRYQASFVLAENPTGSGIGPMDPLVLTAIIAGAIGIIGVLVVVILLKRK